MSFREELKEKLNRSFKRALEKDESSDSEKEEEYFKAPRAMSLKKKKELHSCNALKVVQFHWVIDCKSPDHISFHPGFAHQVFGDEETIVGYEDLKIDFYYAAASLRVFIDVHYSNKNVAAASPPDLMKCFQEWMPEEEVESEKEWRALTRNELLVAVENDARNWKPPGNKITEYKDGEEMFEVWYGKFSDARMRKYHQRMRTFMIWFVDGARYLDDTDEKWDVFMLFKKQGASYCFSGYVTCYPFFSWSGQREKILGSSLERQASRGVQQISKNVEDVVTSIVTKGYESMSEKSKPWYERRFRISQFLVLPPFQRKGHGLRLLNIVYEYAISQYAPIRDFAVEDPSPNFVKLRDYCDLSFVHERGLIGSAQGNNLDAISLALKERFVCQHQINRIKEIVKYMESYRVGGEALEKTVADLKARIYKENSADVPQDDEEAKNEAIANLWVEEEEIFQGSLKKLKLI